MSEPTNQWTIKPCFYGPNCWCRIIVDPEGEACNRYGDVDEVDCQYIVDAMNKTHGAETNLNERHPAPWHVKESEGGRKYVVTTAGLNRDEYDIDELYHCISCVGGIYEEYIDLFIEAVNGFYGGKA